MAEVPLSEYPALRPASQQPWALPSGEKSRTKENTLGQAPLAVARGLRQSPEAELRGWALCPEGQRASLQTAQGEHTQNTLGMGPAPVGACFGSNPARQALAAVETKPLSFLVDRTLFLFSVMMCPL